MSDVKSSAKDTYKKLKELKIDEKKLINANIKKPAVKSNINIPANISKMNSKDSNNSTTNEKHKACAVNEDREKAQLTIRDKTPFNKKQTSNENKSFSENETSEYDDEWRNLNELVFK